MRHGNTVNHLGRTTSHRKAMLSNMASSLILHKRIVTTLAKAKELRKLVEPLITRCKDDTMHNRRTVFSYLNNKEVVTELFNEVSQKVMDRPGGYTRIVKMGYRKGDNAEICMMELVDFNETYKKDAKVSKGRTRRGRRGAATVLGKSEDIQKAEVVETTINPVETKTEDQAEETKE
jgi:large subunit ribosomal protein L17